MKGLGRLLKEEIYGQIGVLRRAVGVNRLKRRDHLKAVETD